MAWTELGGMLIQLAKLFILAPGNTRLYYDAVSASIPDCTSNKVMKRVSFQRG